MEAIIITGIICATAIVCVNALTARGIKIQYKHMTVVRNDIDAETQKAFEEEQKKFACDVTSKLQALFLDDSEVSNDA